MAASNSSAANSQLNPAAASFSMSASTPPNGITSSPPSNHPSTPSTPATVPNGTAKPSKSKKPTVEQSSAAAKPPEAGLGIQLTGAQIKKQKAAEKAARRADKIAEKGEEAQAEASMPPAAVTGSTTKTGLSNLKKDAENASHHKRTGSMGAKILPVRTVAQQQQNTAPGLEKSVVDKRVPMFAHLYPKEKRASLASAGREIHPAVIALGLQLRDYVICGGNARNAAMLLVFKKVIQAYTTPAGVALSRHLTMHLSHQISYLSHARTLSVSQGNSIRWLKKLISALDPDLAENEAKSFLCASIDTFIREKITLADEVIAREAGERIVDGDVILTYGKSSVVEKTLLTAHEAGKKFSVVVVDSRPLFEGKNLARSLIRAGVSVQYALLSGLADAVEGAGVTKCLLGASAMLGNGRLTSRAGTATVAMMANEGVGHGKGKVPVIVLCESIKFTGRVALDSVVMNEIGEADALVETDETDIFTAAATTTPKQTTAAKGGQRNSGSKGDDEQDDDKQKRGLEGWRDQPNLYLLNLMYDVTPAEYLDVIISELGSLPPSAAPVVNGVHGGDE